MSSSTSVLFQFLGLALGSEGKVSLPEVVDWNELIDLSFDQGVDAISVDGYHKWLDLNGGDCLLVTDESLEDLKFEWFGSVLQAEADYDQQMAIASEMAEIYHNEGLRTFVLKGFSIGVLYPEAKHRPCGDLDIHLIYNDGYKRNANKDVSAFEKGNLLIERQGIEVDRFYYVHSKFNYKGLTVENHQHLMPIKGSRKDKRYERKLLSLLEPSKPQYISDTWLESPSPIFQALFILSHAKGHFLTEKITLRHVCDWAMVVNSYRNDVDWNEWKQICEEYDLLKFGYALSQLAVKVCGIVLPFECPSNPDKENALLNDILSPECKIDGNSRLVRHYQIIRNTIHSSWKFRMFSDSSSIMFVKKRILGYLFDKE